VSEHPSYHITTLADFLKVPEDRLAMCLVEFADWLEVTRRTDDLLRTLVPDYPADQPLVKAECFEWIDDGERNITMHLRDTNGNPAIDAHLPEEGEVTVKLHAPPTDPQPARFDTEPE